MEEVVTYIQKNLLNRTGAVELENLARTFGVCETQLKKFFRAFYGIPVRAFIIRQRIEEAMKMLLNPGLSIKEIASKLGYNELSNFSSDFRSFTGHSPRKYRLDNSAFTF